MHPDKVDENAEALIKSGVLDIPILKMLNIPKCILFATGSFSCTLAVYSLLHGKSSRILVFAALISHEALRISYNM
jgi:hypothetical protein